MVHIHLKRKGKLPIFGSYLSLTNRKPLHHTIFINDSNIRSRADVFHLRRQINALGQIMLVSIYCDLCTAPHTNIQIPLTLNGLAVIKNIQIGDIFFFCGRYHHTRQKQQQAQCHQQESSNTAKRFFPYQHFTHYPLSLR